MASKTSLHTGKQEEPSNHDIKYLTELIRDFGVPNAPDVHSALRLIGERYTQIMESILSALSQEELDAPNENTDMYQELDESEIPNTPVEPLVERGPQDVLPDPTVLEIDMARLAHWSLYNDILKNAGGFREESDINGGHVWFGGHDPRGGGHGQFRGCTPENIPSELRKAFSLLEDESDDPVKAAISFYQVFVHCHPFYDANGRIARLLATAYLATYGIWIRWDDLEAHGYPKFLKYLNEAHKRYKLTYTNAQDQKRYEDHLSYLINYARKYVSKNTDPIVR